MALEECDIFVDALFGTGLSRPLEGMGRELVQLARSIGKPVLAVDIPSGMSADSGLPLGEVLPARLTVTLGLPKTGFYSPIGASLTGQIIIDSIGLPDVLLTAPFLNMK